jgi:hypothetical protein
VVSEYYNERLTGRRSSTCPHRCLESGERIPDLVLWCAKRGFKLYAVAVDHEMPKECLVGTGTTTRITPQSAS